MSIRTAGTGLRSLQVGPHRIAASRACQRAMALPLALARGLGFRRPSVRPVMGAASMARDSDVLGTLIGTEACANPGPKL